MASGPNRLARKILAVLLEVALVCVPLVAQQEEYKFRVQSDLVLVNVTVRDKSGNIVTNLKPEDFTILEDNKPQRVVSFDIENIDAVANQDVVQAQPLMGSPPANSSGATGASSNGLDQFKDRRLIVLFFDLSACVAPENGSRPAIIS